MISGGIDLLTGAILALMNLENAFIRISLLFSSFWVLVYLAVLGDRIVERSYLLSIASRLVIDAVERFFVNYS